MAGRGRGRGKSISFNVESLGFGRGESLPATVLQPPALYPIAQFKPAPLVNNEETEYLLALKQELRTAMRDSCYYIKPTEKKRDIERYSDKYRQSQESEKFQPDWKRLPAELQPKSKRKAKAKVAPKIPVKIIKIDITRQLEELEQKESQVPEQEEEEEEKKNEEDEDNEELLFDEEDELEEETDYNLTYFDNGENDDEDDDLDEGPVY